MTYKKIPLAVDALFLSNGKVAPKYLMYETKRFMVQRVISYRRHNPGTVSCIAPIEYTVNVEGQIKKLYFEPETLQWFSIKECE